jgi:hypothetical protein
LQVNVEREVVMDKKWIGALVVAMLVAPPAAANAGGGHDGEGGNTADRGDGPGHGWKHGHAKEQAAPAAAPAPVAATQTNRRETKKRHGRTSAKKRRHVPSPSPAPVARKKVTPGKTHAPKKVTPAKTHASNDARTDKPASHSSNGVKNGHHKTTICHATGSATNPYEMISIPPPAVRAHARHQDGRDIIPAPAGGCPTAASSPPSVQHAVASRLVAVTKRSVPAVATPGAPAAAATEASKVTVGVGSSMIALVGGRSEDRVVAETAASRDRTVGKAGAPAERREQQVLGAAQTVAATPARVTHGLGVEAAGDDGGLPYTGLQIALMLLLGAGAILAGTALHRASRTN